MGCSPEDLLEAMNDREGWRERVRDIRADGTTRWWWLLSILTFSWIGKFSLNYPIKKLSKIFSTIIQIYLSIKMNCGNITGLQREEQGESKKLYKSLRTGRNLYDPSQWNPIIKKILYFSACLSLFSSPLSPPVSSVLSAHLYIYGPSYLCSGCIPSASVLFSVYSPCLFSLFF